MKKTASAVFFAVLRHGVAQKWIYSGLNLNQDKATKLQTVQIVRQGEATPYWFKVKPLYIFRRPDISQGRLKIPTKKSVPPFFFNVDTQPQ